MYADEADRQVYTILDRASRHVTGEAKTFEVERPENTLRQQLIENDLEIELDLQGALDVAAENSRAFQNQKEALYLTALALTTEQHDFALRWGGGGDAGVAGVGDDQAGLTLSDDLAASIETVAGTRIVFNFVNTFFRSLTSSGDLSSLPSVLSLDLTQPLLAGLNPVVNRNSLTQAERDVVYQIRGFERFRVSEAVAIVTEYWRVAQDIQNLASTEASYESVRRDRERSDALFDAGRSDINQRDQARNQELDRENAVIVAQNNISDAEDQFKLSLGLPIESRIIFDVGELDNLAIFGLEPIEMDEEAAVDLALSRRYDYRTALDEVEDAARRIIVAEDLLKSRLDFRSIISVPSDRGQPLDFDWSQISWSAGFDLDLALDKLVERNAYRRALIDLDSAIRSREQLEDTITANVRAALRNMNAAYESYQIELQTQTLSEQRVESSKALLEAGRAIQRDVNEAQDDLLDSQLAVTGALVAFAVSRLNFVRDLEGIVIEPQGLRFDPALPLPTGPREEGVITKGAFSEDKVTQESGR
ncbi:MAG: TolC family protein [Planctomycetota bacterium]|jgi:outer membrane protein TolC